MCGVCVGIWAGGTSIQMCTGTCSLTQSEYQQTETVRQTGQGTHTYSDLKAVLIFIIC